MSKEHVEKKNLEINIAKDLQKEVELILEHILSSIKTTEKLEFNKDLKLNNIQNESATDQKEFRPATKLKKFNIDLQLQTRKENEEEIYDAPKIELELKNFNIKNEPQPVETKPEHDVVKSDNSVVKKAISKSESQEIGAKLAQSLLDELETFVKKEEKANQLKNQNLNEIKIDQAKFSTNSDIEKRSDKFKSLK